MAQDVVVEIGAKIDKLVDGVNQVKEKIGEVHGSTEAFGLSIGHIGELIVEAFAVEKIIKFVEAMGSLGLQTERTMAMLGTSASETLQFSGMAKLTGTSVDGLTTALERLYLNVQRSTRDVFNPAAEALHVLGLQAKDFIGVPTTEYVDKLHDAVVKFNPSMNLTAAVMAVGGRGIAQIIPLLQTSTEQWQHNKEAILAAQEGLAKAIPGMAETHAKITLLGMSLESLGARVFSVFEPAINKAVAAMTKWVQAIDTETIRTAVLTVIDYVARALAVLAGFFETLAGWFVIAKNKLDEFAKATNLITTAVRLALNPVNLFKEIWDRINAKKIAGDIEGAATSTSSWAAAVKRLADELKELFAEQHGPHKPEKDDRSDVEAMNLARREQIEIQKATIDGQLAEIKAGFDRRKIYYQSDVANFGMSEGMKAAAVAEANVAIVQAELDAQIRKRDLYAQNTKDWATEELKRKQLSQQVNTEILKSTLSTRDQEAKLWTDGFKTIQSAWDSQLRGLLTGTTTLTQAMKNIFLDLTIAVIKAFEEMAIKQVASLLAQKTTVLSSITADAAQAFAGFAAFFAPTLGPGAIPAATGLAAEVQAQATGMAALEQGTDYVPHTGLALIHKGEIVIPSGIAEMIRSGQTSANGGGSTVNLHVSALDAASFASWLRGPAGREMAKHVAQTWNNNRDTRPRY